MILSVFPKKRQAVACLMAAAGIVLILSGGLSEAPVVFCGAAIIALLPMLFSLVSLTSSPATTALAVWILVASLLCGEALGFYYRIALWDDHLHLLSGAFFALLGMAYFPGRYQVLGGLSVSALGNSMWEVIEYAADRGLGTNMQKDSIITPPWLPWMAHRAQHVGQIDVGLYDTMTDILVGTAGAFLVFLICRMTPPSRRGWLIPQNADCCEKGDTPRGQQDTLS